MKLLVGKSEPWLFKLYLVGLRGASLIGGKKLHGYLFFIIYLQAWVNFHAVSLSTDEALVLPADRRKLSFLKQCWQSSLPLYIIEKIRNITSNPLPLILTHSSLTLPSCWFSYRDQLVINIFNLFGCRMTNAERGE